MSLKTLCVYEERFQQSIFYYQWCNCDSKGGNERYAAGAYV